jgi:hypothetical protein
VTIIVHYFTVNYRRSNFNPLADRYHGISRRQQFLGASNPRAACAAALRLLSLTGGWSGWSAAHLMLTLLYIARFVPIIIRSSFEHLCFHVSSKGYVK